jgi:hypothetical protein
MTQPVEPRCYYNNIMLEDALQNWSLRQYLLDDDTKERGQISRYTDGRDFIPSRGWRLFLFSTEFRPALEPTQPLSRGVQRPGREADHSPPSSAEVKNGGAVPPLPRTSLWRNA